MAEASPPSSDDTTDLPAQSGGSRVVARVESNGQAMSLSEADYEAIADAVMETERGRWFLKEYARRNRHSDTEVVLDALGRMQSRLDDALGGKRAVTSGEDSVSTALLGRDILDLAEAITQVKKEVRELGAANGDDHFESATSELEAIVQQTENATSEILEAAEKVQEVLWTLREAGADETQCDIIESKIVEIYTACSFQDLTGQRSSKVVRLVSYIERRVSSMMAILGLTAANGDGSAAATEANPVTSAAAMQEGDARPDAELLHGPGSADEQQDQGEIDALMASLPTGPQFEADQIRDEAETAQEVDIDGRIEPVFEQEADVFVSDDDDDFGSRILDAGAIVELHDAEILEQPAEQSLIESAVNAKGASVLFDVEPVEFGGSTLKASSSDDAPLAMAAGLDTFGLNTEAADMFVTDDVTADGAGDAGSWNEGVDQASTAAGQDVFEPDLVEGLIPVAKTVEAPDEAEETEAETSDPEALELADDQATSLDAIIDAEVEVEEEASEEEGLGEADPSLQSDEEVQFDHALAELEQEISQALEPNAAADADSADDADPDTAEDARPDHAINKGLLGDYTDEERIALFS
ncbi:MAG: protein phosphatase CheZ [Devosiaceae bacterium]|nr:protein phosphatase CheZ [Devosiaceae bacterium MH13]